MISTESINDQPAKVTSNYYVLFVCFILLVALWFYSTYLRLRVSHSTCGFVVYSTCDFVCFRLLSWLVVLTVVNGSAGMDLTSRLWCDRSCWYCFMTSTTYYFFAAISSLLLRGLGSMLLMVLFPYGYACMFLQGDKHTTLFVICLCGPNQGLIHTSYFWTLISGMSSKHPISKSV